MNTDYCSLESLFAHIDLDGFGAWVKDNRTRCGWSQRVLGDKAHLSKSYISQLEKGGAKGATLKTLRSVARSLLSSETEAEKIISTYIRHGQSIPETHLEATPHTFYIEGAVSEIQEETSHQNMSELHTFLSLSSTALRWSAQLQLRIADLLDETSHIITAHQSTERVNNRIKDMNTLLSMLDGLPTMPTSSNYEVAVDHLMPAPSK